jgi:hypothetical protein
LKLRYHFTTARHHHYNLTIKSIARWVLAWTTIFNYCDTEKNLPPSEPPQLSARRTWMVHLTRGFRVRLAHTEFYTPILQIHTENKNSKHTMPKKRLPQLCRQAAEANENKCHQREMSASKNYPDEAPEGDSNQDRSALCNAGDPGY